MMNVVEQKSPHQTKFSEKIRYATRTRIYVYLQKRISTKSDTYSQEKLKRLCFSVEKQLMSTAKSENEYSDLRDLEFRVEHLLRTVCKKVSSQRRRASPPAPVGMITVSNAPDTSIPATFSTANNNLPNATLQSGNIPSINYTNGGGSLFNGASAGFPSSSGDSGFNRTANIDHQSMYNDGVRVSDLQRHQTAGANVQMVDVYRPNNIHQISSGFGISRNNSVLPLATRPMTSEELFMSTYMPNLSKPLVQPVDQLQAAPYMHGYSMNNRDSFGSSNLYGVVASPGSTSVLAQNQNPMMRADATFTSNQLNMQGMQQTLLPLYQLGNNGFQSAYTNKENLAQVSRQLLDRGFHQQAHDMEQQGQQRFQQLYPGQLQKQDHLLHEDAYRNQLARGLATPVNHGPSLDVYKEALQKQALNGFRPSKFQYQQNAVKDQYIGAQTASVHNSQLNSSPSFQLHPHQKQPASVQVQTQSSLQKLDPHQKQLASAVVQTHSSQQKRDAHQKQSASVQAQTQSSLQKRDAHQKQPEPAVVQTQPSVQKPQHRQKQPESVLLQMQSSLQKPHPCQKQSESAVVQTQPSVQKPHPRQKKSKQPSLQKPHPHEKQSVSVLVQTQSSLEKPHPHQKQPESVLVQMQSSLEKPHPHQKQPESVLVQMQSSLEKPHPCQKQSSLEKPPPCQKQSSQPSLERPHLHQKQSESVMVQTQPSLQKRHPRQKQSESALVQTQPSLQKPTQISENNNVERQQIGVNLCQITPMQPEAVNRCLSARPPICHQTVSPTSTAKRKRLPDGNNTSSKLDKGYGGPIVRNKVRWILFMSHARYCSAPEGKCGTGFCDRAKETLKHSQHCKVPDCTYRNCLRTRELMPHYKQCRDKSCRVCVTVKNFKKKHREASLLAAKLQLASLQGRQWESLESKQAYNKGSTKAPSVDDDDLQPSMKRLKSDQPSQNATPEKESNLVSVCGVVCKSLSSMDIKGKDGLLSDDCKSVKVEVKPTDTDVSDASVIPITPEVKKHVVEDTPKGKNGGESAMDDKTVCFWVQGESKCMNEMSASKEENVKQSVDEAVDASKMEISSLVELFTPKQVREHIRGLRQWIGQSKSKADKNKAMACSRTENSCQLCAVTNLEFEPIPIYCTPCGVRIKRNASHYTVMAGESRHYVCTPCYNDARENSVSIDGTSIPKATLEKKKSDRPAEEAWVQCDKCQSWQHQICALFNGRTNHGEATKYTCPKCYIQEVEQGERRPLPQNAIPGAKSLPVTTLSNHIEQRLFRNLKKERQERARFQGKSYEEVPGAESLAVRVVASVDKVLEVKECFRELFREENYPSEFPYKSKAILLFQKIESVEVCLFGMFVQEFGTKSGPPNQRRVYISYLDSVKYFRPEVRTVSGEALRTFVYHEILIGYLDYCKKRGFTSCYIWACPPLKGEDYILYCHPEIQKTPKTDKLRDWYLAMLRKASKEDVVVECTNLYDQFFVQSGECRANVTAARLPYFDGDYWPGAAADLLHQMSQEDDGTTSNRKGFTKKVISKRALKAVGQSDLSVNASKDRLTMQKLGEIICPLKEDFIMVHLQHYCKHCCTLMVSGNRWVCNQCKNFQICDKCNEAEQQRGEKERHPVNQKEKHTLFPVAIKDVPIEIEDKDENIESEFFDNRQAFLNLCQGNNYQYDTLRRAKHSSMMLLYHLHNPSAPAFATICTICQQEVENGQGWHCEVCPGYDVCNACYPKASTDHSHNLISRSCATDTVVQQNGQANQNHRLEHEKLKQLLVHASACRSPQCQYPLCRWTKILFKHCLGCKVGARLGCLPCKKLWGLIHRHARFCRDSQCTVIKCRDIRANSIRKQQQSENRRIAAVTEMMRERAAEVTRNS